MERCQEKIISLELQDPTTSLDSPSTENSSFDSQIATQSAATTTVSPSDDENSSIVTVRDNGEPLQLVDVGDDNDIDSDGGDASHNCSEKTSVIQTVVEVVSPLIAGDGSANQISIVRSSDCPFPSLDQYGGDNDDLDRHDGGLLLFNEQNFEDSDEFELSLNDKMKNVLQELVENERVKLSFSKSITEDDDDDDDEDATDGTDKSNNNDDSEWTTEDGSLIEDNGNHQKQKSEVTQIDNPNINEQNANVPEAAADSIDINENDEDDENEGNASVITTTTTVITTTRTSPLATDIDSPISDGQIDADIDVEQDDDESIQEKSEISAATTTSSNVTATSESSSSKSANINKKKKRKSKAKKK